MQQQSWFLVAKVPNRYLTRKGVCCS